MSFYGVEQFEAEGLGGLGADLSPWEASQKIAAATPLGISGWLSQNVAGGVPYIQNAVNDMYQQGYSLEVGQDTGAYSNWPSVFSAALKNGAVSIFGTSDSDVADVLSGMRKAGLVWVRKPTKYVEAARAELVSILPDVPGRLVARTPSMTPMMTDDREAMRAAARTAEASRRAGEDQALQRRITARRPDTSMTDNALVVLNAGVSVAAQIQAERLERQRQQQELIDQQIASGNIPRRMPRGRGGYIPPAPVASNTAGYAMLGVAAVVGIFLLMKRK